MLPIKLVEHHLYLSLIHHQHVDTLRTDLCMYACVCVSACMCACCPSVCLHVCVDVCVCVWMCHVCVHMCVWMCHVCVHMCVWMCHVCACVDVWYVCVCVCVDVSYVHVSVCVHVFPLCQWCSQTQARARATFACARAFACRSFKLAPRAKESACDRKRHGLDTLSTSKGFLES